jgi:acetyl-CoA carboxylase biotin carboxyl carrier protein
MIGTYYASPSPGARPFVDVGDEIKAGQVVGIIEAMKIMNEIVADQAGEVMGILATNGQPVEYGSPLILLALVTGA